MDSVYRTPRRPDGKVRAFNRFSCPSCQGFKPLDGRRRVGAYFICGDCVTRRAAPRKGGAA